MIGPDKGVGLKGVRRDFMDGHGRWGAPAVLPADGAGLIEQDKGVGLEGTAGGA